MKILVLGSGLMGPAAAFNALADPAVTQVTIADMNQAQLDAARAKLANKPGFEKLTTTQLDLSDLTVASHLMAQHDVIVAALPSAIIATGLRAALIARRPWIDLTWPPQDQVPELRRQIEQAGLLVIPGCGVEPGLTEIWARHLAEQLDSVDELHIQCGGIPTTPTGPLGYKIVFGGRRLPLRPYPAAVVENGQLTTVPRYSGVESVAFTGVGECEAWHEGFMPWLLDLAALKNLKTGTQKTVRWPGYAAKVTVLNDMGLLSDELIEVDGVKIAPKKVLDTLLYPHVQMQAADRDITTFRVTVRGEKAGRRAGYQVEMVDRYDELPGFTSMARVTAFTGAMVARMVARGELQGTGLITPEKLIAGPHFDRLIRELAAEKVRFTVTEL
ncbi:MAG: saccharopine dehydrogenase NADP-binding domain-containing protein [Chloroflexi bacterium]|nr:saccharopine dehydrogenase NADP-binding domain-containing protein [Chloroflexota bacterium]